jgi:hypothetical protein
VSKRIEKPSDEYDRRPLMVFLKLMMSAWKLWAGSGVLLCQPTASRGTTKASSTRKSLFFYLLLAISMGLKGPLTSAQRYLHQKVTHEDIRQ